MSFRLVAVAWALACLAAPAPLRAQAQAEARPQAIDRIVAVVGERPILLSEVDEELLLLQSQGQPLPADSAARDALRRQALLRMVDEEILYQKARQDTTIIVTDADVQNAVEEQVRRVRGQFPTENDYRAQLSAAGFGTPEEYRRWLSDTQRRSAYQQRYLEKLRSEGKLHGASVSDTEVRAAFAQSAAQASPRPATVSFRQIVIVPLPTPAQLAAALTRAESALAEVRRGVDFSVVARRLSDDPGSKERGGDVGWFRRGGSASYPGMALPFERAAFRLRQGQISDIVETSFGYHIIIADRVQPGEVKARHILIAPIITSRELEAARVVADTVAARLRAGGNFDTLFALFADTSEQKAVVDYPRQRLMAIYSAALEGLAPGGITPVFALAAEDSLRTKYAVAVLDDIQPERAFNYEEVREQVRTNLQREKAVREYVRTLRRQVYVDIRY